jgi:hypothetical protein
LSRFDPADPAEVQTPPKLIGNSGSGDDRYTYEDENYASDVDFLKKAAAEEILHNAENHVADANENVSESFVCELSVIREEDEENVKEPLVGQKKDEEKVKEPTNGKKIVSFAFQESELAFSAADSEPIFNSPEVRGGSACSSSPSTNQSPGDSDFKQTLTLTTNGTYGNVRRDSQIAANGEKKAKSSWRKSFQKGLGKKRSEESPSSVEEKNSGKKSKGVLHKMRKTMLMGGSPSKKKGKLINSNKSMSRLSMLGCRPLSEALQATRLVLWDVRMRRPARLSPLFFSLSEVVLIIFVGCRSSHISSAAMEMVRLISGGLSQSRARIPKSSTLHYVDKPRVLTKTIQAVRSSSTSLWPICSARAMLPRMGAFFRYRLRRVKHAHELL